MLRPYEMDTDAVSIALIHAISTNTGQASNPLAPAPSTVRETRPPRNSLPRLRGRDGVRIGPNLAADHFGGLTGKQ